jgi:hypothetical protein
MLRPAAMNRTDQDGRKRVGLSTEGKCQSVVTNTLDQFATEALIQRVAAQR